jgi:uncharacterized repeat protein (TIGR01451 family)
MDRRAGSIVSLVVLTALAVPAIAGNDLRVNMTMTPLRPKVGGKVTYRVTITHYGTSFMKNMFVEDIVPNEIVDVVVSGPPEVRLAYTTTEPWGTRYTWATPGDTIQMNYGVTYTFTVSGRVAPVTKPTTVTNTVFIHSVNVCGSCGPVETFAGPAVFKISPPPGKHAKRAVAPAARPSAAAAKSPAARSPAAKSPAKKTTIKKGPPPSR